MGPSCLSRARIIFPSIFRDGVYVLTTSVICNQSHLHHWRVQSKSSKWKSREGLCRKARPQISAKVVVYHLELDHPASSYHCYIAQVFSGDLSWRNPWPWATAIDASLFPCYPPHFFPLILSLSLSLKPDQSQEIDRECDRVCGTTAELLSLDLYSISASLCNSSFTLKKKEIQSIRKKESQTSIFNQDPYVGSHCWVVVVCCINHF